jgi:hypothetical protein
MVADAILAKPRPFPASTDSLGPPPGRHIVTENAMRVRLGRAAALVAAATTAVPLGRMTPALAATTSIVVTNQTAPFGGVVLTGADGLQHIWAGDEINGRCRFDPTGVTVTRDPNSCLLAFAGGPAIKPGNISVDGHYIYLAGRPGRAVAGPLLRPALPRRDRSMGQRWLTPGCGSTTIPV